MLPVVVRITIKTEDIYRWTGLFVMDLDVTFEVFTAVTMKNAIFWDIKTQFVPHRRHITSPLQSPAS
jgi:hypothetical protein